MKKWILGRDIDSLQKNLPSHWLWLRNFLIWALDFLKYKSKEDSIKGVRKTQIYDYFFLLSFNNTYLEMCSVLLLVGSENNIFILSTYVQIQGHCVCLGSNGCCFEQQRL